ncbi:hypothetical protein MMC20_002370 [Loxospora ochrophaea]|nr:hypothetical protein [Loxospora ochrophaea]
MAEGLNEAPPMPVEDTKDVDVPDDDVNPEQAAAEAKDEVDPRKREVLLAGYGNSAGDKIESGLSPVGKPVGKGLETVARPVGGLVEPLVGGLMKGSKAWGDALGVGAGNEDKRKTEEEMKSKEPIGGKDQTADNPLGL